ncbi:alpha-mannosidase [Rhodophyticola porphyridii]|nr:glycoside hydrolase family 38 C-terminal domain-containing protein [Rhodophyticola porphyridii]
MTHSLRLTADKIAQRLRLIRAKEARARVPIDRFVMETLPDAAAMPDTGLMACAAEGPVLDWHSYWGGQDLHFVLRSRFTVPEGWTHPALHLPLGVAGDIFTHPEALVYVDGRPVASADRYHHTIDLAPGLADGQPHDLLLHGWTGLTGWPPDPTDRSQLFMRDCAVLDLDPALQEFVTLAEVALEVARELHDDRPEKHGLLSTLDGAFLELDTRDPMAEAFRASVPAALARLAEGIAQAGAPLDVRLHGIGHAHMDVAYLWPIDQIRQKNARTYANVLRLMEKHPEFIFSHSQPQLYAWTETDFPEMFAAIKARVAEGRWEVLGGMWVEPDANMPGSEALVRQIMLARTWVRAHLGPGAETPVLWLPDTFGFPACLPQLMKQAGLKWFVTNKVNWNQYNQMPSSTTWWEGIDGSRVLAQFLTTPREVQHLPFPTNYKSDLSATEVLGTWRRSTSKDGVHDLMICYGYGDGGGGPTDGLIRKARAYRAIPGAPRLTPGTVRGYFETIEALPGRLPVWQGEFYLEGHRGVLTSQGWIKRANRQAEALLHDAEFLAALAVLAGHDAPDLSEAWRLLLLNQFHDILTGTSIPEVFVDARKDHARIRELAGAALRQAARRLGTGTDAGAPGAGYLLVDGAPLPAPRQVVLDGMEGAVDTATGTPLPCQQVADGLLVSLPAESGYRLTAVRPGPAARVEETRLTVSEAGGWFTMENRFLSLRIGPDGMLHGIRDRQADREVLREGARGNQLQAFEDRPISWDAWDIDIFFEERGEVVADLTRLEIVETGPLRAVIALERRWRQSVIRQRIVLRHDSRRIDFETDVDWNETHFLLKAAFPVAIRAAQATYDIQWGQIERPTHRNTSWDAARFEVPAQKWADLGEAGYGVALLNDGKYGYDVQDDVLRLSLIKSATMPDSGSDQGHHRFTYALLPHPGDWRDHVPAEAYALNHPLRVLPLPGGGTARMPVRSAAPNVVLETLKPAEDGRGVILRLYEGHCRRGPVMLDLDAAIGAVERCGLLEEECEPLPLTGGRVKLTLRPYEIVTLRLIAG